MKTEDRPALTGFGRPARQPYLIETPAGAVVEVPDTCSLADWVTAEEMTEHLLSAARRVDAAPEEDVVVHIGFHQETAHLFLDRVVEAITAARRDASKAEIFVFETIERVADRAAASQSRAAVRPASR